MELFPPAIKLQCRSIVVYQSPLKVAVSKWHFESAQDKSAGKANQITITNEKDRLSQSEIDRMVQEADKYAKLDSGGMQKIE